MPVDIGATDLKSEELELLKSVQKKKNCQLDDQKE